MNIFEKVKRGWNAFNGRDPTHMRMPSGVEVSSFRPDKQRGVFFYNDKTFISSIKNRIAMDVAQVTFQHVKVDENDRYVETVNSTLNDILTLEANKDQTARAFIQDIVYSMLDEGVIAICPTITDDEPRDASINSDDIVAMRVGRIVQWYPDFVLVDLYNELTGRRGQILYPKWQVAIIENPLYVIMNEPNSILKRLLRKLTLLDAVDEQSSSGKLDLIIQLPYGLKSAAKMQQAETRKHDIEMQLSSSKYGIAYIDGTEKVTQLNRPIENNLMNQIEYLTNTLYGQLGVTQAIFDGTADEQTMLNYYNRTIEPIVYTIVDEFKRKFLTQTARTQGHSILARRDPFKLTPVSQIAEIADKFTRNEILTSNEIRSIVGFKPSNDPKADQLINSNLNHDESIENPNLNKEEIQNEQ